MRLHEALARGGEGTGVAGFKERIDGIGGEPPAGHGVIDPLARSRRDHAGRIAGQHNVAAVVPLLERAKRNRRAFAANRFGGVEACGLTQRADRLAE